MRGRAVQPPVFRFIHIGCFSQRNGCRVRVILPLIHHFGIAACHDVASPLPPYVGKTDTEIVPLPPRGKVNRTDSAAIFNDIVAKIK